MVLEAMNSTAEEMNAVAAINTKLEAIITAQAKQITRLLEMNNNLVQSLIAAGKHVAEKNKATEEDKKAATAHKPGKEEKPVREARKCEFCKKRHWGAGVGCRSRKVNRHLRPANWEGEEVDL